MTGGGVGEVEAIGGFDYARLIRLSTKVDYVELDLGPEPRTAEFSDVMTQVAIYCDVKAMVSFDGSKEILHLPDFMYVWSYPVRRITARAVGGSGKLYAWGEKL